MCVCVCVIPGRFLKASMWNLGKALSSVLLRVLTVIDLSMNKKKWYKQISLQSITKTLDVFNKSYKK